MVEKGVCLWCVSVVWYEYGRWEQLADALLLNSSWLTEGGRVTGDG